MNQVFSFWCGNGGGDKAAGLKFPKHKPTLDLIPASLHYIVLDLVDIWMAEQVEIRPGYKRKRFLLSNGTHVLIASYDYTLYVFVWHPESYKIQAKTARAITASFQGVGEFDEDNVEETRRRERKRAHLIDLINEIDAKK